MTVVNHDWDTDVGGINVFNNAYTPGVGDISNFGLLTCRAYIAYNGITKTQNIQTSVEEGLSTSATTLSNIYGAIPYIPLPAKSKSLPGAEDAPTWNIITDNDSDKVGRTYVGKPEQLSQLEFTCPSNMFCKDTSGVKEGLQPKLMEHHSAGSVFTIIMRYDDPMSDSANVKYIVIPKCRIIGISGGNGENDSSAEMTVKFLPMGGKFVPTFKDISRTA